MRSWVGVGAVPIAVVLSGALALRAWALWRAHGHGDDRVLTVDSRQYLDSARALVGDLAYAYEPGGPPSILRPPGYSSFIASVWGVTPDSVWWVLAVQVVVGVVGLALLYRLAVRLLGSPGLALAAVVLVAVDPIQLLASGRVLSDTVFTTLIIGMALACTRAFTETGPDRRWLAVAGVLLAAATFVRPSSYYLPLLVGGLILVFSWPRQRRSGLAAVAAVGVFVLPSVLACGAWQLRNHQQSGSTMFAGVEGFNLYFFSGGSAKAIEEDRPGVEVRAELAEEVGTFSNRTAHDGELPERYPTVGAWYEDLQDRGVDLMLDHPRGTAVMTGRGLERVLLDAPYRPFEQYAAVEMPGWLRWLHQLLPWVLLGGALLGADRLVRRGARADRFAGAVVVTTAAYLVLVSSGGGAESRYRVPVTPFLAIAAMAGAQRCWTFVRRGTHGAAA